jgi:multisubunit Na+/H+ antiporter MnhE subunit
MLRRISGWLALWAIGMVTWLLFVVTLAPEELVAGAIAATFGAVAIAVVHRHDPLRLRLAPVPRWLAGTWRLPWQILVDTVRLAVALWRQIFLGRPVKGRFVTVPFPEDEPEDINATRRVVATTVAALSPNSYLVGIEGGSALVHQLLPGGADAIPASVLKPVPERAGSRS